MENLTLSLGIVAALLHGVAYILYNIQTRQGASKPNAVSWSIWALLSVLNALSFREMSGNTVMTLQFFTGSVMCMITFVLALVGGKFSMPKSWEEWSVFALCIAAIAYWHFKDAAGANQIVVIAFVISFIPTYLGVKRDPFKETPRPWILWTVAFLVSIINIALLHGKILSYVGPGVLLVAHASIAILSSRKRKKRYQSAFVL